jgi:hypothetical protein
MPEVDESQESEETFHAESSYDPARQRRRSDSEFARRPELASGAARRNGVVEPDHPPQGVGRSWLIYVVGTNVSPDHPAFTMPSLFTDNPSYEDMQMLSTLLGPVKPPVATQAQVNSSGGIYRLIVRGRTLLAESIESPGLCVSIGAGERCMICLCDYETAEELRQLHKCQHMYHRECIDQVSKCDLRARVSEKLKSNCLLVAHHGKEQLSDVPRARSRRELGQHRGDNIIACPVRDENMLRPEGCKFTRCDELDDGTLHCLWCFRRATTDWLAKVR